MNARIDSPYYFSSICGDLAAQRAYQDRIEQDDRSAEQIARHLSVSTEYWTDWIKASFLAGLSDPARAVQMPYVRYHSIKGTSSLERQPFAHALSDTLDHEDIMQRLVAVLASSECPQVANLRVAMAEKYAALNARDIAQTEVGDQAALTEVRENGRFAVQRARDATKDLLNGAKKDVEAEASRLIALIQPTEEHIEAERVSKHQAGISTIRSYITQAQGKTSEQIARVLPTIEAIDCGPDRFEEFSGEATKALGEVLLSLRELHATTKAREEEAARLEAQRIEQARVAAELAERQRQIDEQAAELKRRQDEIDRAEREAQAQRDAEAEAACIAALPALPPEVPASPVKDNSVCLSETVESEKQPAATEALPVVAAQAMSLTEAITKTRRRAIFGPPDPVVIAGNVVAIGELSDADAPLTIGIPAIQLKLACGRVVTITGLSRDECAAAGPMFLSPVRLIVEAA